MLKLRSSYIKPADLSITFVIAAQQANKDIQSKICEEIYEW